MCIDLAFRHQNLIFSLPFSLCLSFLSACLSCLRMRMGWCCPWGWSLRESLLVRGPFDWTSWREATCWCLWTRAACWPSSTWGCARTREKPTHAHTFTNASPLFESTSPLRGWFLFLFPWYGLFFQYCLWLVVLSSSPYHPSFSYKVTSTVASVWDNIKRVFSR